MRIPVPPAKPTFHTPMRFDRTAEKLQTLSQEQLLSLLDNLDYHSRSVAFRKTSRRRSSPESCRC